MSDSKAWISFWKLWEEKKHSDNKSLIPMLGWRSISYKQLNLEALFVQGTQELIE